MSIGFFRHYDGYGELSNFYMCSINVNGKIWSSSEHYFQAMKFIYNPEYQEEIRLSRTANDA